jgi:hypothetical protein
MRITDSDGSLWSQLRAEEAASAERERRLEGAREADPHTIGAKLNVLDTDHDGWIDEDDLPYDQLLLLERQRAAEQAAEQAADKPAPKAAQQAVEHAPPEPPVPAPVAPAAEPRPPRATPEADGTASVAPRIDLLA